VWVSRLWRGCGWGFGLFFLSWGNGWWLRGVGPETTVGSGTKWEGKCVLCVVLIRTAGVAVFFLRLDSWCSRDFIRCSRDSLGIPFSKPSNSYPIFIFMNNRLCPHFYPFDFVRSTVYAYMAVTPITRYSFILLYDKHSPYHLSSRIGDRKWIIYLGMAHNMCSYGIGFRY
jgi:hypothetical protein